MFNGKMFLGAWVADDSIGADGSILGLIHRSELRPRQLPNLCWMIFRRDGMEVFSLTGLARWAAAGSLLGNNGLKAKLP